MKNLWPLIFLSACSAPTVVIDTSSPTVRLQGPSQLQTGEAKIFVLNASAEGDATAHYISHQLLPLTKVSGLARGLPVGADLDLADRVTLSHAFAGRLSL